MNNQKLIFSILIFFLIICIQNLYAVQTVFKPILSNIQNIDKIENKSKVLNDIFIFFNEKIDLDKFSGEWGLKYKYALKTPNAYVFFAQNNDHIQKILPELREKKFIDGVFQDKIVFFVPHNDLLPPEPITISDPFYFPNSRQDWYGQWHLERTNVPEVWKQGIGGKGVVVGILDSGIDYEHEDLRGNYKTESSYDFSCRYLTYYDAEHDILSCGDDDPSSESNLEHHGTQVVGLASASVNNLGVVGVAPHSKFSSLRVLPPENINSGYIQNFKIDMRSMRESGFADAMLYASDRKTSLQNRIHIKNGSFGVATPYNLYKSIVYAIEKSTKAGTIHVQSASNDRSFVMEDANKSFYLNRPEVITVAASDYYDKFASYSSFGSNVFISAPAGTKIEGIPDYSIPHNTTTKLERSQHAVISLQENDFDNNKYTRFFSGTSASAPIVSGILALAKQVNPQLNTRMAKHLLVKSSTVIDRNDNSESSQGGWQTNGAGNYFNPNYGFGLINAEKFVALARNVKGVTELKIINNINDKTENIISCSYSPWYSSNYPDENGQCPKVSNTFLVKTPGFIKQLPIEDVIVTLELEQVQLLDLSVELISPSGTRSRLAYSHDSNTFSSSGSDLKWDFLSNAFWGENPQGTWRVEIYSKAGNIRYPGKINRVKLSLRTGKLL